MNQKKRVLIAMLTFFGAFMAGLLLANFLHEFGHAVATWTVGGTVYRITLNPLSWNYTYIQNVPDDWMVAIDLSGALFAALVGTLIYFLAARSRSGYALPFLMTGVLAWASNGVYYLADLLTKTGGDAWDMVNLGVPAWLVFLVGLGLVVASALVALTIPTRLGLRSGDSLLVCMVTLVSGVVLYFVARLVYELLILGMGYVYPLTQTLIGAGLAVLLGLLVWRLLSRRLLARRQGGFYTGKDFPALTWRHAAFALALGLIPAALELALFT